MRNLLWMILSLIFLSGCLTSEKAKELAGTNGLGTTSGSGDGGEASSLGFVITAITPSAGSFAGGYNITISGSRFDGSTTFAIDGVNCTSTTIVSSSSAICRVPAGVVGAKDVTATKPGFTNTLAGGFQYLGAATVTGLAPATAPATIPTLITVSGTNLISGATVQVAHPSLPLLPCQPVTVAANGLSLTCYTPALTPAQSHTVYSSGITSSILITNPDTTQVSLPNSLTLTPAPQYTSMSFGASGTTAPPRDGVLNSGAGAYTLTINGNYFTAGVSIQVNSNAAGSCAFVNSTTITCTALPSVPSEGNYNVTVTNPDGQLTTNSILFVNKPTITGTTPTNVRYTGGDIPQINGTGLGLNPTITIYNNANTVSLGSCPVATSSPLTCTTPALGSAQATTIRLTNDYGYRTTFNPLQFISATTLTMTNTEVGRVVQGSSYTHTVTLNNPSLTVAATGINIDTSAIAAPFSYVSTTCGATLAASSSCNIVFTYAPTSLTFHRSGYIDVDYNNGVSAQTLSSSIVGWSVPLDIMVASLDYGTVPYGINHQGAGNEARFTKPLVLINRGKATVTLNSGAFTTGTQWVRTPVAERFSQAAPLNYECGATLAAGAKCVWALDFQPTSSGAKSDIYTITYNGTYTKSANLTGTGGVATLTTCNPANTTWNAQGAGTVGSPYLICTEAQFTDLITASQANTGSSRSAVYLQTADITFTSNLANPVYTSGTFSYSGGGYRLINVVINQPAVANRALFYGTNTSSAISDLQSYNSNVTGTDQTASLVSYYINITNSYAYGKVTGANSTGGLFSSGNNFSSISNSYFVGEVTCAGTYCGGTSATSNNTTNVFSHGKVTGNVNVGGIHGETSYAPSGVYSSMTVIGSSTVGGITGSNSASITNAHFYGTITASSSIGGITGASLAGQSINQSSFMGQISATSQYVGGIVGAIYPAWTNPTGVNTSVSSGNITALSGGAGGIFGQISNGGHVSTITDSFSLSQITASVGATGGLSGHNGTVAANSNITRSYVAYPTGENLYTAGASTNYVVVPQAGTYSSVFYLHGIATDQVLAGVSDLTDAQMLGPTPNAFTIAGYDFTPTTGKWKYSALLPMEGYPYPMLQWMADDWMP